MNEINDATLESVLREKKREVGFGSLTAELIKKYNPSLYEEIKKGELNGDFVTEEGNIEIKDLTSAMVFHYAPDLWTKISGKSAESGEDLYDQIVEAARSRVFFGDILERKRQAKTETNDSQETQKETILEAARTRRFTY